MRLVMPPVGEHSARAALFWLGFDALLGPAWALPAFAGFLLGYLVYDMTHYHMHHHRSKNRLEPGASPLPLPAPLPAGGPRLRRDDAALGQRVPDVAARAAPLVELEVDQQLGPLEVFGRVDVEEEPGRIAECP